MNAIYPAALPQSLPLGTPIEPVDTRVTFQSDAGPGQIMPLMTEEPFTLTVSERYLLTSYQRGVLQAFGVTTLVGWALPFDWVDPWPGAGTLSFRWLAKPSYTPIASAATRAGRPEQVLYRASFRLEWRPWYPPAQVG